MSFGKVNQNVDKYQWQFIPYLDFSKEWTDEKLYKYFNLTSEEINFIDEINLMNSTQILAGVHGSWL
jgi:hypothetical protein